MSPGRSTRRASVHSDSGELPQASRLHDPTVSGWFNKLSKDRRTKRTRPKRLISRREGQGHFRESSRIRVRDGLHSRFLQQRAGASLRAPQRTWSSSRCFSMSVYSSPESRERTARSCPSEAGNVPGGRSEAATSMTGWSPNSEDRVAHLTRSTGISRCTRSFLRFEQSALHKPHGDAFCGVTRNALRPMLHHPSNRPQVR